MTGSLSISFNEKGEYWYGTIKYGSGEYFFQIYYTSLYPLFPPRFYCFSDATYKYLYIDEQWKSHIYVGGGLCLFASDEGESGWKPSYRIDVVIKKFLVLLEMTSVEKVPTQHTSKRFSIENYALPAAVYLPNRLYEKLRKSNYGEPFICSFFSPPVKIPQRPQLPIIALFEENDLESKIWPFALRGNGFSFFLPQNKFRKLKNLLIHPKEFQEFCVENHISINYENKSNVFLMGCKNKPSLPPYLIHFFSGYPVPVLEFVKIEDKYSFFESIFRRETSYLTGSFELLQKKKVLVIGLGTLGAKIVTELGRNGVREFYIFDYDIFLPENVARGVAPWELVGKPKTDVIALILNSISPTIITHPYHISPLNPLIKAEFEKILQHIDLVVCAIDSELDEKEIQRLCVINKCNSIYTIALENGHYGRIYRVIPDITACPECILHQINEEPEKYPNLIKSKIDSAIPNRNPYHQPGIPGINIDLWEIALKTTRFCLETLARSTPLSQYFPDPPYHHFLMSNQAGWIFDAPYQIRIQDFKKLDDCPLCGTGEHEKRNDIDKQNAEKFSRLREKYVV